MTEKEALIRLKTGNFNGGRGFDMQLLVDAAGIIGKMLNSGRISKVVRCKDCKNAELALDGKIIRCKIRGWHKNDWFCADGERR